MLTIAKINTEVLGLQLSGALNLDVTISTLAQIPNAIEQYVKDSVVDYLENNIAAPIVQAAEAAYNVCLDSTSICSHLADEFLCRLQTKLSAYFLVTSTL